MYTVSQKTHQLWNGIAQKLKIVRIDFDEIWQKYSILETFEYFCQISSKSITIILSYTVSKLVHFFETQYSITTDMTLCWLVYCCCCCSWSRSDSCISAHVTLLMPKTRPLNSLIISGRRCLSTAEPCPRHSASISPKPTWNIRHSHLALMFIYISTTSADLWSRKVVILFLCFCCCTHIE